MTLLELVLDRYTAPAETQHSSRSNPKTPAGRYVTAERRLPAVAVAGPGPPWHGQGHGMRAAVFAGGVTLQIRLHCVSSASCSV